MLSITIVASSARAVQLLKVLDGTVWQASLGAGYEAP